MVNTQEALFSINQNVYIILKIFNPFVFFSNSKSKIYSLQGENDLFKM